MITTSYVRTMAAYNAEMNRNIFKVAGTLTDVQRRKECGTFWSSIHGTLCHLFWADLVWMHRLAGWAKPDVKLAESGQFIQDFDELTQRRGRADAEITEWAETITDNFLLGSLSWFSAASGKDVTAPVSLLLTHMFNHQTHHRGQVHTLLTQSGAKPGDTDLFILVPEIVGHRPL